MKIFYTVALVLIAVSALAIIIFHPFTIIAAGQSGVVSLFGNVRDEVLDSGFHLVNPLANVHKFTIQTQKAEAEASAASSDLQTVTTRVAVNYHLDPVQVIELFRNVGKNDKFITNIVAPAIQDSVKAATASYTAEQLITQRALVSEAIKTALSARLAPYALVESVALTNFDFSESFNTAIEAKVTAEQNALASKNLLEQKKYEAEQIIVTAQAEAEAIRIKAQAITQQGGKEYVDLEAVYQWNGVLPTYLTGDSVPFINLSK